MLGSEKKWYGTYSDKNDAQLCRKQSSDVFRATSGLERRELRSKEKGKKSFHFNGGEENIKLILRTVTSVNQLSIYGAVADLRRELSKLWET